MNRICPVCETLLRHDDERVVRRALGNLIWLHNGQCVDTWDENPPRRTPARRAA